MYGIIVKKDNTILPPSYYPLMQGKICFQDGNIKIFFEGAIMRMMLSNRPLFGMNKIKDDKDEYKISVNNINLEFRNISSLLKDRYIGTKFEDNNMTKDQFLMSFTTNHKYEIMYGFGIGNDAKKFFLSQKYNELAQTSMNWYK